MPQANIYVFTEPRNWKARPGSMFPLLYSDPVELETAALNYLAGENVYKVTAFNTYNDLILELYKSPKRKPDANANRSAEK